MKKLKSLLQSDFEFFFLAIFIVLICAFKFNFFFLIPLVIVLFYFRNYKHYKLIVVFSLLFLSYTYFYDYYLGIEKTYVYVYDVKQDYSLSTGYLIDKPLKKNTVYKVEGNVEELNKQTVLGGFNQEKYYLSKGIKYKLELVNYEEVYEFTILNLVEDYVDNLNVSEKAKSYINTLILGNNEIDEEMNENYQTLSISHLFSVSGFHIILYASFLLIILEKFFKKQTSEGIVSVILIGLIFISGFKVSIIRASLLFIIKYIFTRLNLEKSSLEILSIVTIIVLLLNPNIIIDYGFILSFLTSFVIVISYLFNKNIITISLIAFLVTLPIIINLNGGISIYSIFYNIFYVLVFSFVFIPCSLLSFLGLDLFNFYDKLIFFIEDITLFLLDYNKVITFKSLHIIFIFIYYMLLFLIFKNIEKKKFDFFSFTFIEILLYISNINLFEKIVIIDVGQGSSALVMNGDNYLIDTGGSRFYDLADVRIKPLLKFYNVNKLNVFISHADFDHVGAYDELSELVEINKTYISKYSSSKLQSLVTNTSFVGPLDRVSNFQVIYPYEYKDNENNRSLVLKYTFENGETILFPGDSEEFEFYDKVDYLVLGHHGSNTSFNEQVLNKTNFKVGFISVGKNNTYGHPSKEVIYTLDTNHKRYYQTSLDNSLYIINVFGEIKVFTQKQIQYFYGIY